MEATVMAVNANLGCGWDVRDGYVNIDAQAFHGPDVVADVRRLPFRTGSFDEVVAQDLLEHLPRADCGPVLAECARLVAAGGRLVVRTTNLVGLFRLFFQKWSPAGHAELVQCLYGTQAYPGDWHVNGFTELLLREALTAAGFDVESIATRDEWLFDVVAIRV
jgi:ubiquinone/menaquinone biosynthesis C-methylase UbiE